MLSRVAHNLYWMSRYLERVEHTARVIDVDLVLMLDQAPHHAGQRWERLLRMLRAELPAGRPEEPQALVTSLVCDRGTPQSVLAMLGHARDNARQVRNQVSSEMWEQINQLYLQVSRATIEDVWDGQTHALFRRIKEGVQLFHGITEATMRRDEGWYFMRVGACVERAEGTLALLDSYFARPPVEELEGEGTDYLDLVGLLKARTGFEAYVQVYTADLRPERIAGFLLFSAEFPHSVRHAAEEIQRALLTIAAQTPARNSQQVQRVAGRLRASLDYEEIEDVMDAGLDSYLRQVQQQFARLHLLLEETYFEPPLQAVLAW